ncbi:MAG: hypothetical protein Q9M41_08395 [Paracoccaceae bacterium]|nr:hypothetical protein [Paracoccaceae bacterium]
MEKTLRELAPLLKVGQVHKDFCLARFREIDNEKRAVEARIEALESQRSPRIANVAEGVLAEKWMEWRRGQLKKLTAELADIGTRWNLARKQAQKAVGRVEVIQELIKRQSESLGSRRARKAEHDAPENATRLV